MPERPLSAFALVLIGGVIVLATGVLITVEALTGRVRIIDLIRPTIPDIIEENLGTLEIGLLGAIFGLIIVVGSILIVTGVIPNVRSGAIAALFFAIMRSTLVQSAQLQV